MNISDSLKLKMLAAAGAVVLSGASANAEPGKDQGAGNDTKAAKQAAKAALKAQKSAAKANAKAAKIEGKQCAGTVKVNSSGQCTGTKTGVNSTQVTPQKDPCIACGRG